MISFPALRPILLAGLVFASVFMLAQDANTGSGQADPGATITSEVVVTDAAFPVGLDFAPDGRLFYTEHCSGDIRIVTADDQLLPDPFAHINVTPQCGDWGLTGITLDPDFTTNHYVYVAYMQHVSFDPLIAQPIVVRFTEVDNIGTDQTIIVDNLPLTVEQTQHHHGIDEIHFGPDGYLYVSIGDLNNPEPVSQDLSRTEGKLLRVNKADGSAPPDNPFVDTPGADPRIYAYGLRNSYGFTWHSRTGAIFATENGPANCDELNLIVPGGNYGWPYPYEPDSCDVAVGIQPIHWFTFFFWGDPWEGNNGSAPAGIVHIDGDVYPSLGDSLLACEWKTVQMKHLRLTPTADDVANDQYDPDNNLVYGCNVAIEIAPSGAIYYTGDEYAVDDTILRLKIDSDSDGVIDGTDNCPAWVNAAQGLPPWSVPARDPDCDGFSTAVETSAGTDPHVHCGAGAWPPDINDDGFADITDISLVGDSFGKAVPPAPARHDVAPDPPDGVVDITDISRMGGFFGKSCVPVATPTPTPSPSPTPSPTPTATPTAKPTPTSTPTPAATASASATPTATPTMTPTPTP